MNNNSNTTYNCNSHNNSYNSRYTKGISHISTYTYTILSKCVHTLLDSIREPLRICLTASIVLTTSCNTSHIYRVEYKDGSVEYYETKPDNVQDTTINSVIRLKPDDINRYE